MQGITSPEIERTLSRVSAHTAALARAKAIYLDRLAPDFTPFEFIKLDELMLSRLIGWLISPVGTHGQGGRFLKLLSSRCGLNWNDGQCAAASLMLEHSTASGRIDILVQTGDELLAIENKPRAQDQPDQLARYLSHLRGSGGTKWRLVYLTPAGSEPTYTSITEAELAASISSNELQLMSYEGDIVQWLADCRAICRADRISDFLQYVSETIQSTFGTRMNPTDLDHIASEISKSPEAVSAAMTIVIADQRIKESLCRSLLDQTIASSPRDWKVSSTLSPARYAELAIDYDPASICVFKLQFDRPNFNQLAYGLCLREENGGDATDVRQRLLSAVGPGEGDSVPGEWWPWWRYASPHDPVFPAELNWSGSPDVWASIANGSLSKHVVRCAETVITAAKQPAT